MKALCILGLSLFAFGSAAVASAPVSISSECLSRLASGENREQAKIPRPALEKLARSMEARASTLQEDQVGLLVDYTKNSKEKRAYMIDFKACDVLSSDYVMHGGAYYAPTAQFDGDPTFSGLLRTCTNKQGTRENMTRPGLYITKGCHHTTKPKFTVLEGDCKGVNLVGLEKTNNDAFAAGVVLHELTNMPNNTSIKPMGQGCPTFAPGHLKALLRYGLMKDTLVLVYAPQCK